MLEFAKALGLKNNKEEINIINIKKNVINVDEFNYLYDAVGWGHYEKNITEKSLNNTIYSISVYDDKKIIGYGRIIGDGICFYIFMI